MKNETEKLQKKRRGNTKLKMREREGSQSAVGGEHCRGVPELYTFSEAARE
jgi:hypothetical protein